MFDKIASRLAAVGVRLADHIASDLSSGRDTLQGIKFTPKLHPVTKKPTILAALKRATDACGQPAFAVEDLDPSHWALKASFGETIGTGFREIWRPRLTNRPLHWREGRPGLNVPALDAGFSAHFGDNITLPDLSSLHCGVTGLLCGIHIDEMGFVMELESGEVVINPDFIRHYVVELIWKTKLHGKVPPWFVDHVNLIVPSSPNKYSRLGVSFDLVQSEKVKLSLTGSCGIEGGFNCSGAISLFGTHDVFGDGR